jgi:hypothetical protein
LLYCCIALLLYCCIALLLYCCIAALLHLFLFIYHLHHDDSTSIRWIF